MRVDAKSAKDKERDRNSLNSYMYYYKLDADHSGLSKCRKGSDVVDPCPLVCV